MYAHTRRIVMVIGQTLQRCMAAGQPLQAGSNLTIDWSAPFQLKHQVPTNIIMVMQLMTELKGTPLRGKQTHKEQVSFWKNEWIKVIMRRVGGSQHKKNTRLTCGIHAVLFWSHDSKPLEQKAQVRLQAWYQFRTLSKQASWPVHTEHHLPSSTRDA